MTETATPTPAQTITLPAFGTPVPGQGATVDGIQQPAVALIVSDATHEKSTAWGTYGKNIDGCDSRTDGHANTLAMLAANCPAAVHARSITADGHSDYFVPSIGELNTAAANAPELFEPEGMYWASTQDSPGGAVVQDFEDGDSYWNIKGVSRLVRPFRAIPLQTLIASAL